MEVFTSLAIPVISAAIALFSAIWLFQQTRVLRQTNMLPVLVDMFREFRSYEFKKHQRYIYNKLSKECIPNKTGYSSLPESARKHVLPVSFFFDNIGLLVVSGMVDEKLVLGFLGGAIPAMWRLLSPYINEERRRRKAPEYQACFEHLAARSQRLDLETIYKEMKFQKTIETTKNRNRKTDNNWV